MPQEVHAFSPSRPLPGEIRKRLNFILILTYPNLQDLRVGSPVRRIVASSGTPSMSEKSVLIIDDQEAVRFTIAEALRMAGYAATGASSIEEALRVVHSRPPDLIICDLHIERHEDGFDALAQIRRQSDTSAIPFILITGGFDATVIRRGMDEGANDFLVKPFNPRQLVASVDACLGSSPAEPADDIAPHCLLEMVNDVPMLVGACDPVSTRFEFLNRFGMHLLQLDGAEVVPKVAFSEICVIANGGRDFAETWAATRRDGTWMGHARIQVGSSTQTPVSLALTAHQDPGSTRHFVTVLARTLTSPTTI